MNSVRLRHIALLFLPLLAGTQAARAQAAKPAEPPQPQACADCPAMVLIPAGSFEMGSPDTEAGRYGSESPLHRVAVAAFQLGRHEVSRAQFAAFVAATGYDAGDHCSTSEGGKMARRAERNWRNPGYVQTDQDPVVCVSWDDAQAYVKWLSQRSAQSYRLPSEAEWEYAARAGTRSARPWGEDSEGACRFANVMDLTGKSRLPGVSWPAHGCDDGYAYAAPVASFQANGFGLFDMIGNVWEWTEDCWNANYTGAPADGSAWTGGDCKKRVNRGGGWYGEPRDARSAYRDTLPAPARDANLGFRVARTAL